MDLAAWGAVVPAVLAFLLWAKFRVEEMGSPWTSALLGLNAVALSWWFWRDIFWIEIAETGGGVRWGHRGDEWSGLPVAVERFAGGRDITPWDKRYTRYFPVAILPDGAHAKPLRHYRTWVKGSVVDRVEALNAALARCRR